MTGPPVELGAGRVSSRGASRDPEEDPLGWALAVAVAEEEGADALEVFEKLEPRALASHEFWVHWSRAVELGRRVYRQEVVEAHEVSDS